MLVVNKNSEILNSLLELNVNSADQIKNLTTEINNLKINRMDNSENKSKWCKFCKNISHETEYFWFKVK